MALRPSLRAWLSTLLLLCFLVPYATAQSPASNAPTSNRQADETPAARVYIGMYLHDISDLSLNEGTYDIDADLWVKWRGQFNPEEIRFANAAELERDILETESDEDWHSARWRVRGTLRGDFPVQNFPFDQQKLTVQLELPRHLGDLTPDLAGSGISSTFSITDWTWSREFRPVVTTETYPSDLGKITDEGRPAEVRRVSFEVSLARPFTPVALKLFLPLGIVALIVFLSLFVPLTNLQPPLTMCVTGLVAVFAFQFSVSDVMPSVAYLTLADVLFITVYVLAVCCVTVLVTAHVLHLRDHTRAATVLRRIARVVLPIGVGLAVFFAMPSPSKTEAMQEAEAPEITRATSAQSTLRIGTTLPLRLANTPIGAASLWGLSYLDDQGRAQALMVERMPRMDNDAMRFLADGSLEVTWTFREDARWSDDRPLITEDILLPLKLRPDPRITHIDTPDDRTVVLRWNARVVDALRPPTLWPSEHLKNSVDLQDADVLNRALGYDAQPTTGPYRILDVSERKITAERNPNFPLPPAPIANIEVIHYPDSSALRDALLAKEIDLTTPNGITEAELDAFAEHPDFVIDEAPNQSVVFLALPLDQPPWDALDARRALLQAIDRTRLAHQPYGNDQPLAHVPTTDAPADDISRVSYDPNGARAFFESWPEEQRTLTLTWSAPMSRDTVQSLADDLQAVGLDVNVQKIESTWPHWLSQDFDGLLLHTLRVEARGNPAQWWALPTVNGQIQRDRRHAAWTDDIHALVDQYEHALFWERREQLRERIDRAWAEALPLIPLYFAQQHVIVAKNLHGWDTPTDQLFGRTLLEWYVGSDD